MFKSYCLWSLSVDKCRKCLIVLVDEDNENIVTCLNHIALDIFVEISVKIIKILGLNADPQLNDCRKNDRFPRIKFLFTKLWLILRTYQPV